MRLSEQTLASLDARAIQVPYDRAAGSKQIVHLGLGAFTRAHQAVFTEDAIATSGEVWRIIGVSMRSATVRDQLAPQDCLFTVTTKGEGAPATRLVRCLSDIIVAPEDPARVVSAIADPKTHIVTLTVTEKGYHLSGRQDDALDPLLQDDPASPAPRTIYGYLAQGLKQRRDQGLPGLTILSCDNLADNGTRLRAMLLKVLTGTDPQLARWCADNCTFPCSMVDRIVPATQPDDIDRLESMIGLRDEAAVFTEPFRQWVIEDRFAGPRPPWEAAGAEIVADVRPYETAKLRMLNGAHSALAYLGLAKGHELVSQAMADPDIGALIRSLMRDEAADSFQPAAGQDLQAYAASLETRFANPALPHRLAQIAMDGSQKIPQRWLATLADRQAQEKASPAILRALAAWIAHVRGDNPHVSDPRAEALALAWKQAGRDGIAAALFAESGLIASSWKPTSDELAALSSHLETMAD
ncbi:fructuronate reductase [Sphingobium sp. B1D7B]|uniref:mannitol dehydrogenase family protein n=1 Tax=unclassified Sphingobium TaxID=2611147 RepID=UPI0022250C98|nr:MULTISPECIES: mannitol dehydrogenase family protein [unclassified Sphingobium]MCW2392818.1 fructuronate reductase [Sphingobium sp. B11D3A]MCW2404552.1 fructuronate reductase [Sphingobium sp. B1D7B]